MTISNVCYYGDRAKVFPVVKQEAGYEPLANEWFGKRWHDQAILKLRSWDLKIDGLMDKNSVQKAADLFADKFGKSLAQMQTYLVKEFAPLVQFNALLEKYGRGEWHQQFAVFLIQLPFKATRNIVRMFYSLVETACYTAAHPIKGLNHIAKQLVGIIYECTKFQTWSQMGAGMLGASLGQAACGNPISLGSFLLGSIFLVSSMLGHSVAEAWEAEKGEGWNAVKGVLISHTLALPEAVATGFLLGVITVGIQRAILRYKKAAIAKFEFESRPYAERFVKENNLPAYTKMHFENGKICLEWSGKDLQAFYDAHSDWWTKFGDRFYWDNRPELDVVNGCDLNASLKIQLHPAASELHLPMYDRWPSSWGDAWEPWDVDYWMKNSTKVVPLEPTGMKVTALPSKFPSPLPEMSSATLPTPPEPCPWCPPKPPAPVNPLSKLLTTDNLVKPLPGVPAGFEEERERA